MNQPRYVDVPEGVTYLENKQQFWQAKIEGKNVVVTTGTIGTPGKAKKTKTKGDWSARVEIQKQLLLQLANGFTYVLHGKPPKRTAIAAQNKQLEAQVEKDPSALEVYADWLQEQGDIRGELAALQAKPGDKKLARAATKLLWEQRAYFYGPLAPYVIQQDNRDRAVIATWRSGWMDSLTLGACGAWGAGEIAVDTAAELVKLLPRVASARFLQSLAISRPIADGEFNFADSIAAIVSVMPKLTALRRLTLGAFDANDTELSWAHLGSLAKLWKVAGDLAYLRLRAGTMQLGKIALPAARTLIVETGGLDKRNLAAITDARWPKLETLSVWFGKTEYGCTCELAGVQPILDGKGFGKLRHLGLKNAQFGAEIAAAIPKSKIIRQLDTLDLSMSHITTEDLERDLLPHKAAFAKLSHLDLSRCLLDDKGQKLAKQLAKSVNLERQRNWSDYAEDPEYRYAAVGE